MYARRRHLLRLTLKRGGIGHLRRPFLTLRALMRSIGYGALARRVGITFGLRVWRCPDPHPVRLRKLRRTDLPFSRGGGARGESYAMALPHRGDGAQPSTWRVHVSALPALACATRDAGATPGAEQRGVGRQ